ncbi:MAG TPA: DUF4241 domain-containing protein [Pseudonocardiaceae bacterium]|jgi:hypothetical protein|nr:DUF4241 domain-containing protein [Pseudonocardiaceae bacterium]
MSVPQNDFETLFTEGAQLSCGDAVATMRVVSAGNLQLPTGRVAVTAAPYSPDPQVFATQVPPGTYPVQLARADLSGVEDWRPRVVAAAKLVISDEPTVTWRPALFDEPGADDPRTAVCAIDGGTGCFGSPEIFAAILANRDRHFRSVVNTAAYAGEDSTATYADSDLGASVVVFASGWGDASYTTWAGYAANGSHTCFVTDFDIFNLDVFAGDEGEDDEDELELELEDDE